MPCTNRRPGHTTVRRQSFEECQEHCNSSSRQCLMTSYRPTLSERRRSWSKTYCLTQCLELWLWHVRERGENPERRDRCHRRLRPAHMRWNTCLPRRTHSMILTEASTSEALYGLREAETWQSISKAVVFAQTSIQRIHHHSESVHTRALLTYWLAAAVD